MYSTSGDGLWLQQETQQLLCFLKERNRCCPLDIISESMDLGFGNKLSKSILRIHACVYSNHAIAEIIFHVSDENVIIKHTFTMICFRFRIMVFNATFDNISVISWRSVLLVEETEVPGENQRPIVSHRQTLSHNVVSRTRCA